VGGESFLSAVAKNFVKQLSSRPHDWHGYFAFLHAPLNSK